MSVTRKFSVLFAALALLASGAPWFAGSARAAIIISEVDPSGSASSSNSYNADWWELTNTGTSAVDITGWKMDDNSYGSPVSAEVALRNVTSIAAGQSVVFIEGTASGSTDGTIDAAFEAFWFGSNVPAGFTVGNYGGSGVGLSQTADAVNIYDSTGTQVVGVSFGATLSGVSLDNTAGIGGAGPYSSGSPAPVISTNSVDGVNGAFSSFAQGSDDANEIGSPGVYAPPAVPEPSSLCLGGLALLGLSLAGYRRKK